MKTKKADARLHVRVPVALKIKLMAAAKKRKISIAEEVRYRLEVTPKPPTNHLYQP